MYLFMLHEAKFYHERLCPAIAASARSKSFAPMRALAEELAPTIGAFVKEFYLTTEERPLVELLGVTHWERRLWRFYAGEFLLYAAAEVPEIKVEPDVLGQWVPADLADRLYRGSRDVDFQGYGYRRGRAGLHDESDLKQLASELAAIDTAGWACNPAGEMEDSERIEELEWIRNRFSELRGIVDRACATNSVVVCEEV